MNAAKMKIRFFMSIFLLVILPISAYAQSEIKGELNEIDGIPVLRVWGSPYEMGYAQGRLLGNQIVEEFEHYIMPLVLHQASIYNLATTIFTSLYTVPERYRSEAQGVIDGAADGGVDIFVRDLQRDLTPLDLATAGAMPDIIGLFGCSSLMAWGDATADDPVLAGEAAIVRNLDWVPTPFDPTYLARRSIVIAREPNDRRSTISIFFPGLLGCLSCMNDAGVSVLQHQKHPSVPLSDRDFSKKFIPINLAMREALELDDPDGDGVSTPDDAAFVIDSLPRSSQYVVMCLGADFEDHPPFVLETTNLESLKRYDSDTPDFPPGTIAATNDFRKLDEGTDCERYATMRDNVNAWEGRLTIDRMWENNGDVAVNYWGSITAQTMIFIPARRRIGFAFMDADLMPTDKEPVWFEWEDIFPEINSDDDAEADDDDAVLPLDPDTENSDEQACGCT
jgi:hypothetical protein